MKLLYIDVYHHYMNPTSGLTATLVATAVPDVRYYGPGFSSDHELEKGLLAFVDATGPYDGVVLGPQVPVFAWNDERKLASVDHVRRYSAFAPPAAKLLPFYRDVLENFTRLPVRLRFVSLLNYDYYSATARHSDTIEALDAYVLAPGRQFLRTVDELPDWSGEERHVARKQSQISDAWGEYLARRRDRVVNFVHFISDSEFSFRNLDDRKHRLTIPGIEYFMRKQGRQVLKQRGIRASNKFLPTAVRLANRLGLPAFSNYLIMQAFNAEYRGKLIDSRFVYTAPEAFGMPVRKFFEIPACGAVMLCVPPHSFADLGFVSGVHYLDVDLDSLPDALMSLERDPDRAQAIASAGRKLVFERHSLSARAAQFRDCLQVIERGEFAGSEWRSGEFVTQTHSESSAKMIVARV